MRSAFPGGNRGNNRGRVIMSKKLGLKKLHCEVCGTEREVEAGIRELYCCAQPMKEVVEEEGEKPQTIKLKPKP